MGREDGPQAQEVSPGNPVTGGAGPGAAAPPLKGALGAVAGPGRGEERVGPPGPVSALCLCPRPGRSEWPELSPRPPIGFLPRAVPP